MEQQCHKLLELRQETVVAGLWKKYSVKKKGAEMKTY